LVRLPDIHRRVAVAQRFFVLAHTTQYRALLELDFGAKEWRVYVETTHGREAVVNMIGSGFVVTLLDL